MFRRALALSGLLAILFLLWSGGLFQPEKNPDGYVIEIGEGGLSRLIDGGNELIAIDDVGKDFTSYLESAENPRTVILVHESMGCKDAADKMAVEIIESVRRVMPDVVVTVADPCRIQYSSAEPSKG